jgi:hypothetical protein
MTNNVQGYVKINKFIHVMVQAEDPLGAKFEQANFQIS